MEATTRQENAHLNLTNVQRYQFVELLRQLENNGELAQWKLLPDPKLSFPAADIRQAHDFVLRLAFMGLYGVDSPLPHYFLHEAVRQEDSALCLQAFLDIFNHRLYTLFYLAWKKSQPVISLEQHKNDYLRHLMALSGNALTLDDQHAFALAGLFGNKTPNALALQGMIQHFLFGLPVKINQFIPRWLKISSLSILGNSMALGIDTLMGEQVVDLSSQIRIDIGPMDFADVLTLLPGEPKACALQNLIERYLDISVRFSLRFIVRAPANKIFALGKDAIQLGWLSWVGEMREEIYCIDFW